MDTKVLLESMTGTADFSPCQTYRYRLTRTWGTGTKRATFLMLNPSTADAKDLDPTLTRCLNFAIKWGCDAMWVVNLFALRSTDPQKLYKHFDPVGPRNDKFILDAAIGSTHLVAGWGTHGKFTRRDERVMEMLRDANIDMECLGMTKEGHPRHPLYLKASTELIPFGV